MKVFLWQISLFSVDVVAKWNAAENRTTDSFTAFLFCFLSVKKNDIA